MKKALEIQIPDSNLDKPQVDRLFLIGIACLSLGVFISYLSAHNIGQSKKPKKDIAVSQNALSSSEKNQIGNETTSAISALSANEKVHTNRAPTLMTDRKIKSHIPTKSGLQSEARAISNVSRNQIEPRQESSSIAKRRHPRSDRERVKKRNFKYGRVAYIRCDGVRKRRGRFPCPRDKRLERATWRILKRITECKVADTGTGHSDIRLIFRSDDPTAVEILPSNGKERNLDQSAVYECVNSQLTYLSTSLKPEEMIVSFQFELQGPT